MVPARLMDTRLGNHTVDDQFAGGGPLATNSTSNLTVLGRAGIPISGVSAVALSVTVTDPTDPGFVTVWPAGPTRPNASNLNLNPGKSISNQVVTKLGTGSQVSIFVYSGSAGSANVVVDVVGYFLTTSDFVALTPARLLDTRPGQQTVDGLFAGAGAFASGEARSLPVFGRGGLPTSGVTAVVINVTATNPTAPSFITVWPSDASFPVASNLNVVAGQTIPNLVMVAPSSTGYISLYNNAGATDLIVDVVGYFTSTRTFNPLVPARLLDTRGYATIDGQSSGQGPIGSFGTLNLPVLGRGGVPTGGVGAVALNVTVVSPTATGYLTAWGKDTTQGNAPPPTMDANFNPSDVIPKLVIAQVGPDGQVSFFNSNGSTSVVADVVGWFPSPSSSNSFFYTVPSDFLITANQSAPWSTSQEVYGRTITLPTASWVYAQLDGRYYSSRMPYGDSADVFATVDGVRITGMAMTDWSTSNHSSQHCYNGVGAVYLAAGQHTVSLRANGKNTYIGAGSNLSFFVNPATNVNVSSTSNTYGPYGFSYTTAQSQGTAPIPYATVIQNQITSPPGTPIFSFSAFTEQNSTYSGDALSTIYLNGQEPTLTQATWTNNDYFPAIEKAAPMFSQSLFASSGSDNISLIATVYPWIVNGGHNLVTYTVNKPSLVSVYGGMRVYGSSPSQFLSPSSYNTVWFGSASCIGTNQNWPGCPAVGTPVLLASQTIDVPFGHSGEVLFMAKTRMQGDKSDGGGQVVLYINIDGNNTPTTGVQGITSADGESQRTLSTSYFATGNNRLAPGTHTVQVYVAAQGSFIHMTVANDLPLVWFD